MNLNDPLSRRDALKTLGAGAALLGLGTLPASRAGAAESSAVETQPFTLPKLGYAYDALEPHIDARTMEIHHTKHHAAYVANANAALKEASELQSLKATELLQKLPTVPDKIRMTVRNNVGGHVNHTFFWQVIAPGGSGSPQGSLAGAIDKAFGSFDAFKAQFSDAATNRFGSGWAWLCVKGGTLAVHSTANQDSPLMEGMIPVLALDVWEHAYYLKYHNVRADYIKAFWSVANWRQAQAAYAAASM